MGGAHRAEPAGELALGGVANGLRGCCDDGEDRPEPRRIEHHRERSRRATIM